MRENFSAAAIQSASEKISRERLGDFAQSQNSSWPNARFAERIGGDLRWSAGGVTVASRCSPRILRHTSFSPHLMFDRRYTRHAESNSF
jgi:hypothetical protein